MTTISVIGRRPIGTPDTASLTWQVYSSFDQLRIMRREWDCFVEKLDGNIYSSFDWCRVWWQYYGANRDLLVFVFRAGQELVGVVPMFVEGVSLGPVFLRVAKLLVSDHTLALCDPPVRTEYARKVFETLLEGLMCDYGCDAVAFRPLSGFCNTVQVLREIFDQRSDLGEIARSEMIGSNTMFELPERFEDYLAGLKSGDRRNYQRRYRLLTKSFDLLEEVVRDPTEAEREFDNFTDIHRLQWKSEGKLGHFWDWPKGKAFHLELVRSQARLGRLRLYCLRANGEVISSQYGYVFGHSLHWYLSARATGTQWKRFGLGRIGLAKTVESAIGEGIRRIEAGCGHYPYKLAMGGRECALRSMLIVAPGMSSWLRQRLFCLGANALNLLYYRIFFSRVAPLLPWRQRPLWRTWIRSRL